MVDLRSGRLEPNYGLPMAESAECLDMTADSAKFTVLLVLEAFLSNIRTSLPGLFTPGSKYCTQGTKGPKSKNSMVPTDFLHPGTLIPVKLLLPGTFAAEEGKY